ncbi:hypothetical protein COLO4_34355 [Corchorus olitorius]|uniref:Uncharacterized protein n=1 Tax=Corchorus olitorius TaxID=93759 RepID=A0A1R3GL89_9ROSI|nr:hypothetical protein COLO4_34355 [Corchorus olitorius]
MAKEEAWKSKTRMKKKSKRMGHQSFRREFKRSKLVPSQAS